MQGSILNPALIIVFIVELKDRKLCVLLWLIKTTVEHIEHIVKMTGLYFLEDHRSNVPSEAEGIAHGVMDFFGFSFS